MYLPQAVKVVATIPRLEGGTTIRRPRIPDHHCAAGLLPIGRTPATQLTRSSRAVNYVLDVVGKLLAGANPQTFELAQIQHMLLERMTPGNLLARELTSKPRRIREAAGLAYPLCREESIVLQSTSTPAPDDSQRFASEPM